MEGPHISSSASVPANGDSTGILLVDQNSLLLLLLPHKRTEVLYPHHFRKSY